MVEITQKRKFLFIFLTALFLIGSMFFLKPIAYFLYIKVLIPGYTMPLSINEMCKIQQDTLLILDTRSFEEYSVSHLKGANWIGYEAFTPDKIANYARDTTVVLYCSVGYRSDIVGKKLQDAGFRNVYNLWGGIFAWVNTGLPVYHQDKVTDKIHPYSKSWGFWLIKGEKILPGKK